MYSTSNLRKVLKYIPLTTLFFFSQRSFFQAFVGLDMKTFVHNRAIPTLQYTTEVYKIHTRIICSAVEFPRIKTMAYSRLHSSATQSKATAKTDAIFLTTPLDAINVNIKYVKIVTEVKQIIVHQLNAQTHHFASKLKNFQIQQAQAQEVIITS